MRVKDPLALGTAFGAIVIVLTLVGAGVSLSLALFTGALAGDAGTPGQTAPSWGTSLGEAILPPLPATAVATPGANPTPAMAPAWGDASPEEAALPTLAAMAALPLGRMGQGTTLRVAAMATADTALPPLPALTPAATTASVVVPTPSVTVLRSLEASRIPWGVISSRPPANSPPTRLVIPRIKLDTAIRPVGLQTIQEHGKTKLIWGTVDDAAGFHQTSAYPGNAGNTVINGHRDISGSVFLHLDRMEVGDRIIVLVGDVAYHYYATEVLVLPEALASAEQRERNAQLMGPMSEERLTLITCTPLGLATHRLLVVAKP